jgi:outer membrane protein TolC
MIAMRPLILLVIAAAAATSLRAQVAGPSLALDDAVRLALANNRTLKVVSYSRGIAHANWLAAVGVFDPTVVFNRSYSDSRTPYEFALGQYSLDEYRSNSYSLGIQGLAPWGLVYSVTGSAQNQGDLYSGFAPNFYTFGGFQVTQPLLRGFGFGANLAGVRIARANRTISEWEYRQSAMNTVTNVVIAYSNLLYAHDGLRIARRFLDLRTSTAEDTEKGYKLGFNSNSDVITARAQAAGLQESVLIAERAVRDAEDQLRFLIGQDAFPANQPLYSLEPMAPPDDIVVRPEEDLRLALAQRPDYQQARLGLEIDRANHAAARNGLLPEVDFVGGYGYNGLSSSFSASRQMVANQMNPSFTAGLQVSIPLTFAQARGKARAARLQLEQDDEGLRLLEANIALSLSTAAGQIETTRKRVEADRAAYDLARQALDAEVKKLHAGTSYILFVLESQGNLAAAEVNLSGAIAAQQQAAANYELQLGSALKRHNITFAEP